MRWLSAENLVTVATAILGIVASAVTVRVRAAGAAPPGAPPTPSRQWGSIGYRVQSDTPIGDDDRAGRTNRRAGWFDTAAGMTNAGMVLLRIGNDGSQWTAP